MLHGCCRVIFDIRFDLDVVGGGDEDLDGDGEEDPRYRRVSRDVGHAGI